MWLAAVVLASLATGSRSQLAIRTFSPESGTVIPASTSATLTCTSTVPWYICIWEGPGGIACQCQSQVGGVNALCQGYPRLSLTGGGYECVATISNISPEDAGQWRCVMVDNSQFTSVAQIIDVEVGTAAVVSWVNLGGSVSVQEQQEVDLVCEAVGGYPEPKITFEGSNNMRPDRQITTLTGNLIDASNTAFYTGHMEDHNNNLVCIATQYDRLGNVIYTSQADFNLQVAALDSGSALAIPIGGIIGIILAILIIFLLCAILACLLFRRKKQRKAEYYHIEKEEIKEVIKPETPSNPVEHSVHVTGGDDIIKNYDVNINHHFNSDLEKEKLLSSSDTNSIKKLDVNDSDIYIGSFNGGKKTKGSLSSLSSIDSLKGDSINDSGMQESNKTKSIIKTDNASNINSLYKHDSTFMYNGTMYREEVFEDYIVQENNIVIPPVKKPKAKWKNNLSNITEERSSQLRDIESQREEEGYQKSNLAKYEYEFQQMQLNMMGDKNDEERRFPEKSRKPKHESNLQEPNLKNDLHRFDQSWREYWTAKSSSIQSTEKDHQAKSTKFKEAIVNTKTTTGVHDQNSDSNIAIDATVTRKENIVKFAPESNISNQEERQRQSNIEKVLIETHRGYDNPYGSYETVENKSEKLTEILTSDGSDERNKRNFQDEHYYIGDSEYAEVVEEHVQGKYENDLEYYKGKSKEQITVHPKVWKYEEIYYREASENNQVMRGDSYRDKQKVKLPENNENESKLEYVQNWISTENLQEFSPMSMDSRKNGSKSFSFDHQELDRSDESCIVDVEVAKSTKSSVSQDKSSRISHSSNKNRYNRDNQYQKYVTNHTDTVLNKADKAANHPQYKVENIIRDDYVSSASRYEKSKDSKKSQQRVQNSGKTSNIVQEEFKDATQSSSGHVYKITQQEIIFYLKNKDGVVKIVHRPLLRHGLNQATPQPSFLRHKSQPNLYSSHILRHVDDPFDDVKGNDIVDHKSELGHQHLHIPNVGVLQQSLSMSKFMGIGAEGSSGSIFDCDMKCFKDSYEDERKSPFV